MMSHNPLDQDLSEQGLETLSALLDGALEGDAARFALRRLGHDAHWRQAAGRWQLAGDVLRGQPLAVAPAGFAERVAAAVAVEPPRSSPAPVSAPANARPLHAARRRWIGGAALAASVAMVAMFVVRPFMASTTAPGAPVTTTQVASTVPAPTPSQRLPSTDMKQPQPADPAARLATAAIAVAQLPRRAAERRSRGQSQRAALRVSGRQSQPISTAASGPVLASVESTAIAPASVASTNNPFRPPHTEPVSRPWPRAVLPSSPATGPFAASYGSSATSPSFYPFEPRLPASSEAVPDARGVRP